MTLPERVLDNLLSVDADRARAIVKCVEATTGVGEDSRKPVELIEVMPGKALIIVGPSRTLPSIGWLRLVEIAPARYLLVLPSGTPVETLEVAIHDLLAELPEGDERERCLLVSLREMIGGGRRRKTVTKAELVFIDIQQHR